MAMTCTDGRCAKPRAVLTKEQAIDIFRLSTSSYPKLVRPTATSVARAFGVSEKTIRDIWNGRTWYDETLPLDLSRPSKPPKKTGRPLGSKDSAPRRARKMSRCETKPLGSGVVSDDSSQTLLNSTAKAKKEGGAEIFNMGASRLQPDHFPQCLRLLSESAGDSLPSSLPLNRDSIPFSSVQFGHSASIDHKTLLTKQPWPVLIPPVVTAPPISSASWTTPSSAMSWSAAAYNCGQFVTPPAQVPTPQQACLSLALLSATAARLDAAGSIFSLDPALSEPRPPLPAPPPAAFWSLAAALPLHQAAQSAGPGAVGSAASAAGPRFG